MYLVARIRAAQNIEVRLRTEVVAARGDGHLEALTVADRDTGAEELLTSWLFVFIGASPRAATTSLRSRTSELFCTARIRATR